MTDGGTEITQSSRLKPGSQNARIVEALTANGGWMTTAELHRAAGFSRLNSRIAELREYGYTIPSRHVVGKIGPHATEYRLTGTPEAESDTSTGSYPGAADGGVALSASGASSAEPCGATAAQVPVQLDIFEAVAA